MTTAGNLVFQGIGRGQFVAYDARTGEKLWSFDAGLGIIAAPTTYEAEGVQYVSILVGYGGSAGNGLELFGYGWCVDEKPPRLLYLALRQEPAPPLAPPPPFTDQPADDAALIH